MGDPRKQRSKYSGPKHPWEADRIKEEKEITKKYGMVNKKEIWKMQAILTRFKRQAKSLIARRDDQAIIEEKQLMDKLVKLGLIKPGSKIASILGLSLDDVMNLRLQTAVFNKGLANSIKQARQFIVHGHISISGKKVNVPSYMLKIDEVNKISFIGGFTYKEDKPEKPIVMEKQESEVKNG